MIELLNFLCEHWIFSLLGALIILGALESILNTIIKVNTIKGLAKLGEKEKFLEEIKKKEG